MNLFAVNAQPQKRQQRGCSSTPLLATEEGAAIVANLSLRDFEMLIGERFSISSPGRKLGKLTLIEATDADAAKPSSVSHAAGHVAALGHGPALTTFVLRFQGAGGTLPQDTYIMSQSGLGTFPLFLVPEGPGGSNRPTYLATFTRFAEAALNKPATPSE